MEEKEKKPFGLRAASGKKNLMKAGNKYYLVAQSYCPLSVDYPNSTYDPPNTPLWQRVVLPEEFI